MNIVKSIGDFFRSSPPSNTTPLDRYEILSPLLSVQEYVDKANMLMLLLTGSTTISDLCSGRKKTDSKVVNSGIEAYKDYVKGLSHHEQSIEKKSPFSTIISVLQASKNNLDQIENNFTQLFNIQNASIDETNLRSSSLVVIGYIETVSDFCTWVSSLARHLTADDHEMIPPFETKTLILKSGNFGSFASFTLSKWTGNSIIDDVKSMQKKGSDVAIKTGDEWIDTFMHDAQFSPTEQDLMSASLRSPMMMRISSSIAHQQAKLDLLSNRKDWLIAKISLESEKMRGLDPSSHEYKKLKKATEYYSNLVSKFEQKIERMRA